MRSAWPRRSCPRHHLRETDGDVMNASELREKSEAELNEVLMVCSRPVQPPHAEGDG